MRAYISRKVVIVSSVLVLLVGATAAVAATRGASGSRSSAYVAALARHLNVSPEGLTAAIRATDLEQIKTALAAGKITKAQAEAATKRVEDGAALPFLAHRLGGRRGAAGRTAAISAAAQYLGTTASSLRQQLQSGKSLAQIAGATPGKSVAGLRAAIIAAATTRLEAAVAAGRITSAQEQQKLQLLSSRIEARLQRTGTAQTHRTRKG